MDKLSYRFTKVKGSVIISSEIIFMFKRIIEGGSACYENHFNHSY